MTEKKIISKILHDFATPVTALVNFLEIFELDAGNKDNFFVEIKKNAQKIFDMIIIWRCMISGSVDQILSENYFMDLVNFSQKYKNIKIEIGAIKSADNLDFELIYKTLFVLFHLMCVDGSIKVNAVKTCLNFEFSKNSLQLQENFLQQDEIFIGLVNWQNFEKKFSIDLKEQDENYYLKLTGK